MTSFDGLIDARAAQFARRFAAANAPRVPGADVALREETTGEFWLNILGKGEELPAKTLGRLFTNNPKYEEPIFGSYHTRAGFTDLASDAGLPPLAATIVGLAAAIANPIDPINKLQVGRLTKLGVLTRGIDRVGGIGKLARGADGFHRFDVTDIVEKIAKHQKELKSGKLHSEVAISAEKSLTRERRALRDQEALNEMFIEMQKRGAKVEDLKFGKSIADQIKLGQRKLLGFTDPLSLEHLSLFGFGRGALDQATVIGAPKEIESALVSAASGLSDVVFKPIKSSIEKLGGILGLPQKTEIIKQFEAQVKKLFTVGRATNEQNAGQILNLLHRLIASGVPKEELVQVINALELPYEIKAVVQETLDNALLEGISLGRGSAIGTIKDSTVLTPDEKLKLLPQGIDQDEVAFAVSSYKQSDAPEFTLGKHQQHKARLIGEYVVLNYADDVDESVLTKLDGIYGNKGWVKHNDGEGNSWLVAKRLPFSNRVRNARDLNVDHLFHLENIAAQLATKKLAFVGLTSKDILTSPSGAVQIINPERIVEFKKVSDALINTRQTLEGLAFEMGLPRGPILDLPNLQSIKAARAVPKGITGMEFRVVASAVNPDDLTVNAQQLLNQASNTTEFKNYISSSYSGEVVEEFEQANNIARIRQNIRQSVKAGQQPQFDPIELMIGDDGLLYIREGRDRLTAAILEGFEHVPIKRVDYTGEILPINAGYFTGKVDRLEDIWYSDLSKTTTASTLDKPTRQLVSQQYGIVTLKGKLHQLKETDVSIPPEFAAELNRFVTAGPRFVGRARGSRIQVAHTLLESRFGSPRNGMIAIADLAEVAQEPRVFIDQLKQLFINPQTGRGIDLDNIIAHPKLDEFFIGLRKAATDTLDSLSRSGILTNRTVNDPRRIGLAIKAFDDGIIQVADFKTNTLKMYGESAPVEHLKKTAEEFISNQSGLGTVDAFLKVEAHGANGTKVFELGQLENIQTPSIIGESAVRIFKISNTEKKALEKQGVYIATSANADTISKQLEKRGLNFGVLLKKMHVPGKGEIVVRPTFTYFVSASGDLFISTKHKDVNDLLETVFKEGPRYFQEYGVITPGKIILSNPSGSNMDRLGLGELRSITRRLQDIAKKFHNLGFRKETEISVYVPFDNAIWRSMYGEHTTISNLLDEGFKLNVGKEFLGMSVDNSLSTPSYINVDVKGSIGVTGVEKTRLKNKVLQELFETLQNNFDNAFLEEAKRNLPVSYHAGYFARILTKQTKDALSEAYLKYPHKESQSFKNFERFFHGRVPTDLTTQEFNEVIKRFQKEGLDHPSEIIADIVRQFRNGYLLKPTKESAAILVELSKLTPEGINFFELDPLFAASTRFIQSAKAITRADVVESIKSSGIVVWSGSVDELRQARVGASRIVGPLDTQVREAESRLLEAQNRLQELKRLVPDTNTVQVSEAEKLIINRQNDLATAIAKRAKHMDKISKGKAMEMMVDLNAKEAWISGDDATRLIQQGLIKEADILGDAGDSFIRVPIQKYESSLQGTNTEVFLFPPEVHNVIRNYFGSTTKEGFQKFLALWDEVHAAWRAWTLFPIPAYHVRNGISNMFMAWLGGVTNPESYTQSFRMLQLMTSYHKGKLTKYQVEQALRSMDFINQYGQVVDGHQMYQAFVNNGGLLGGLHHNEFSNFGTIRRNAEFERLMVKHGLRPSSELSGTWLFDNTLLRRGVTAAAYTENRFRLAAFVDAWSKGKVERQFGQTLSGFESAAIHMKRVFYNYGDLSAFEKTWLRRTIPFYSWMRFNIPRMMTTLITEPIIHFRLVQAFNDLERAVAGGPIPENEIEQWMRDRYGIVVSKTDKGNYVVKTAEGFLPMHDAYKLLARGGIFQSFLDGLTPFVKVPLEQLANLSYFTDKPIEKYPGERAASFTLGQAGFSRRMTREGPLGLLNLLLNESTFKGFIRAGGEITKVMDMILDDRTFKKETPGITVTMLGLALGRFYMSDPEQTRNAIYSKWKRNRSSMKGLRKYALEVGDDKAVEDLDRIITHLELGNPGK